MRERVPEPWGRFFDALDGLVDQPVALHCFGGFALIHAHGVARTTNDVDFVSVIPHPMRARLVEWAGEGSQLHRRYRLHVDAVGVATVPEHYERRLIPLFAGAWERLTLYALEAHDLALSKLERNLERDRDDVLRLARAGLLDRETLVRRYREELRPYLAREAWHDQTLGMWVESCWPEEG